VAQREDGPKPSQQVRGGFDAAFAKLLWPLVYIMYNPSASSLISPVIDHGVAVSQPSEAGHLVTRRGAVEVDDDVVVRDQEFQTADHVTDAAV